MAAQGPPLRSNACNGFLKRMEQILHRRCAGSGWHDWRMIICLVSFPLHSIELSRRHPEQPGAGSPGASAKDLFCDWRDVSCR